jgi:hypothetical protein
MIPQQLVIKDLKIDCDSIYFEELEVQVEMIWSLQEV